MGDSLVYTDVMKGQSGLEEDFKPPTPKDFTEGTVYACTAAGRPDFALFGKNDSGRFQSPSYRSSQAMSDMMAIQPATTQAVFIYAKDFDEADVRAGCCCTGCKAGGAHTYHPSLSVSDRQTIHIEYGRFTRSQLRPDGSTLFNSGNEHLHLLSGRTIDRAI